MQKNIENASERVHGFRRFLRQVWWLAAGGGRRAAQRRRPTVCDRRPVCHGPAWPACSAAAVAHIEGNFPPLPLPDGTGNDPQSQTKQGHDEPGGDRFKHAAESSVGKSRQTIGQKNAPAGKISAARSRAGLSAARVLSFRGSEPGDGDAFRGTLVPAGLTGGSVRWLVLGPEAWQGTENAPLECG